MAEGQGVWNGEVCGDRLRKAWCVQLRCLDVTHWTVVSKMGENTLELYEMTHWGVEGKCEYLDFYLKI